MSNNKNYGIIGFGNVGQALYFSLKDDGVIHDKYKKPYQDNFEEILKTNIVFICVPTPEKDPLSEMRRVLDDLDLHNYEGIVVIKSTVPPKSLEKYFKDTNLKLVANPEFLNQNTRFKDALNQKIIVLGGDAVLIEKVIAFYNRNLKVTDVEYYPMSFEEAMYFKYVRNLYSAWKVTFWNIIEDTIGNSRFYNDMLEKLPLSDKIIVGLDGKRGYGGACLPKDAKNFNTKVRFHPLISDMIKYNEEIRN